MSQKWMQALFLFVNKITVQHWMGDLLHKLIFKACLLSIHMEHYWFLWDTYGCFLWAQLNHFKLGLTFWSDNPLYSISSAWAAHISCRPCSQINVSNMRLSQQHLVREPFLFLMAWPTSQFRELIKAVWWRSCSCVMSLTDAQLSKIRNAQLVAFMGPINMH